jgi:hypothetical protein
MKVTPQTPEEREEALRILRAFKHPVSTGDPKAWARRLRYRELSGERLSIYQRDAWRTALGASGSEATSTYDERQAR